VASIAFNVSITGNAVLDCTTLNAVTNKKSLLAIDMTMLDIDYRNRIVALKREKNTVILAHNYQSPEVQDIADFIGDSLALSRIAAETDADTILFCGVHFMAETASIICPNKKVLIPDLEAGCSLATSITQQS